MTKIVTHKKDSNGFTLCRGESAYRKQSAADNSLVTCKLCIKKIAPRYEMAMEAVSKVFSALLPEKKSFNLIDKLLAVRQMTDFKAKAMEIFYGDPVDCLLTDLIARALEAEYIRGVEDAEKDYITGKSRGLQEAAHIAETYHEQTGKVIAEEIRKLAPKNESK